MKRPLVAVTMGDPAGIGPEIVAKTFAATDFANANRAVVVGDPGLLARAIRTVDVPLTVRVVDDRTLGMEEVGTIPVLPATELPTDLPFGELDCRAGAAAYEYVRVATQLALDGRVQAIATAPLNKEAMHLAGVEHPGHTEILAALSGTSNYAMMLIADDLRVIHVSTHVPMLEAVRRVERARELGIIRLADSTLRRMGIARPRIAVAGLNPHAGENRLFGNEDADEILPAVQDAVTEGIDASGPWPGDTAFMRARRGEFDIVVAQYHDQGHIPIKLLGFDTGVNVTVGLPFFRTSVDHGTAFDIAGTGRADHRSLRAAIDLATKLSIATAHNV